MLQRFDRQYEESGTDPIGAACASQKSLIQGSVTTVNQKCSML